MALSYLPVDRSQAFLLPPDMAEWLPENHLVWFVLDVVAKVDTSSLHARHPNVGPGRRAYDPEMLLALLIYAYCSGQRSSRQIERLCEVDVAYRVICANRAPDHTTIARFRRDHQAQAVALFTDVLVLCAASGLARVGIVSVDGTKMGANAALDANRARSAIEAEVAAMMAEAKEIDATQDELFGDARGDELPPKLASPRSRGAHLDAALRELEAQAAARREAEAAARAAANAAWEERKRDAAAQGRRLSGARPAVADPVAEAEEALAGEEAKLAERIRARAEREAANAAAGRRTSGPKPTYDRRSLRRARRRLERAAQVQAQPDIGDSLSARDQSSRADGDQGRPKPGPMPTTAAPGDAGARVNTTDPQSRIMKTRQGWIQGYNAQAAVNELGIVLAAGVTNEPNDCAQCGPMMALTRSSLEAAGVTDAIGTMLFDAGYWSEANAGLSGPDRLIATTKDWKQRKKARQLGTATGPPPLDASPLDAMEHRLRTAEGTALYAKRSTTVEPTFGQIKEGRGFRRFVRHGLAAANGEWQLICATHNVMKLFRHQLNA
jgi:transposase